MKNRIYNYVRTNSYATVQQVAEACNLTQLETLKILNQLCDDGYMGIRPRPLDDANGVSNSALYHVTNKYFTESEAKQIGNESPQR